MPQSCPGRALGLSALRSHSGTGLAGLQLCSTFGDLGHPHAFFSLPTPPLGSADGRGGGSLSTIPELPKRAAPLSPCSSSSPGGTKSLSPTFGFCPPLGTTGPGPLAPVSECLQFFCVSAVRCAFGSAFVFTAAVIILLFAFCLPFPAPLFG